MINRSKNDVRTIIEDILLEPLSKCSNTLSDTELEIISGGLPTDRKRTYWNESDGCIPGPEY